MTVNEKFCSDLYQKIFSQFLSGHSKFLFWGISAECFALINLLKENNLENIVTGVVDDRDPGGNFRMENIAVIAPRDIVNYEFDVLVITTDVEKEKALKKYMAADRRLPQVIISGTGHLGFDDEDFYRLKSSSLVKSYATGYDNTLIHIYQTVKYLHDSEISGDVAEFGIFKGGTISLIRKMLDFAGYDRNKVNMFGFDCFSGFPERKSVLDMYVNPKCEYRDYQSVKTHCENYNIKVIEGNIVDTYTVLSDKKLMLTFFDTDNYTPVRTVLEYCFERTVPGGAVVFDHYTTRDEFVETIGERMAAKEALKNKKVFHLHGTGVFIKI